MAKIQLGDWGTYWFVSGGNNPNPVMDWEVRFNLKYEQNTSDNTTTIYAQPYVKEWTSGTTTPSKTFSIRTTINGTSKNQTIYTYSSTAGTEKYQYYYGSTQTFTITHASDGTASCSLSGRAVDEDSIVRTCSHTYSLPTINVASTITNNTTTSSRIDFGQDVTFLITRPNNNITHTLTYEVDGTTQTIGTGIGTSKTFPFPTSLISSFTTTATPSIVVTCTSSNGTTSTTTVYLNVPSTYKPSVALSVVDQNSTTSGWGVWVQNKSILKYTLTPAISEGSPIQSYSTTINGTPYSEQTKTFNPLTLSGTVTITSNVTDKRGRTSANQTQTLSVQPYTTPSFIKAEVVRCDSSGNNDNDGTYGKVVCQYKISSCNTRNAKSLTVTYGNTTKTFDLSSYEGTVTATSSQLFSGLSTSANHTFTFKLIDSFNSSGISQEYIMPPSYVLMSYHNGGKGITLGRIATEDGFNVYMDSRLQKVSVDDIKGKNLLVLPEKSYSDTSTTYTLLSNGFRVTAVSAGTYRYSTIRLFDLTPYAGETLTISASFAGDGLKNLEVSRATFTFTDKTVFDTLGSSVPTATFTVPSVSDMGNSHYLFFRGYASGSTSMASGTYTDYTNIQLEKGSTATSYVPYKKYGYNPQESMGDIITDNIEGKNLFDISTLGNKFSFYNNTTFKILDDTSFSVTTPATTSGTYYVTSLINVKPYTNYTVSYSKTGTNSADRIRIYNGTLSSQIINTTDNPFTFNTGNNNRVHIVFYVDYRTGTNTYSNVQMELGDVATPYTKYKSFGNNSFESLGNLVVDSIKGKNLFNPFILEGNTSQGITWAINDNGSITISGTSNGSTTFSNNINKKIPAGTYTFSINRTLGFWLKCRFRTVSDTWKYANISDTGTSTTVTFTEDIQYYQFYIDGLSNNQQLNRTIFYQIEKGDKETQYAPYTMFDGHVYSTHEKVVGEWIDGKPLYEKTFSGSVTANSNYSFADISGLNYDYFSIYEASFYKKNTNNVYYWMPVYYSSSADYARAYTRSSDQKLVVELYGSSMSSNKVYITVRYTKTTD